MKTIPVYVIVFAFISLSLINTANGQSAGKLNTLYLELGGNGLFTSINYERQLLRKTGLNFHVGAGSYGITPTYLTIPLGINYLVKLKNPNSYIDLGFGATYSKADVALYAIVEHRDPVYKNTNYWNYIPGIGFRKLTKSNLMFRFSFTPVINHNDLFPFLGFSIGKSY